MIRRTCIGGRCARQLTLTGALVVLLAATASRAQPTGKRPLGLDDLFQQRAVSDPHVAPEGNWVAYTVRRLDLETDERTSDVWMTSWDGARSVRLTTSPKSEHTPRWSPDGRWLAFLSDRGDEREVDQLWMLDRSGGEAEKITEFEGGVLDYAWAPDGARLALVVEDPDPDSPPPGEDKSKPKTAKPIVIDRLQFKKDIDGYLGKRRQHLHLLELRNRKTEILTPGEFNEALPAWSPDGRSVAFVSKRGADIDRTDNWDVFVIDARPGAVPRQLTTFAGNDNDPEWESPLAWSPDGWFIAYLQGGPQELIYYAVHKLAVVSVREGMTRLVCSDLDRNASQPQWSGDGRSIFFLLEDDRVRHVATVAASGGKVERLLAGRRVVDAFDLGARSRLAILASTPEVPPEVFALEAKMRPLSRQNDAWLAELELGRVEEIEFASPDGTRLGGFVVKPPHFSPGTRYPAVLRIHGGPVSQYGNEFDFSWQLLAARGYLVVACNPRGSSGRGETFSTAIYADWGNKDAQDLLAAVDHVVARGLADPARLGVGGWSYGGMLTNYVIAQDARFKAAVSGASISNILAGYGTDQYIREYESELGLPWRNLDTWLRISFPFLHAERITTPTLFLCGEKDFNVPLLNSEQMYQALRSLGVETQLVIYPGQHHEIKKPSYQKDRLERSLAWYDKHLGASAVVKRDGN